MCKKGIVRCAATDCGITKCDVIEMTICFHTVNGVIRIKIEHIFGMMKSY